MRIVYLHQLSESRSGVGPVRFAAYELKNERLEVIWSESHYNPDESDSQRTARSKREAAKLGMTYSRSDKYPAFHYSRSGCGYSKAQCISEDISRLVFPGEEVRVYVLGGCTPSLVGTFKDGKYAERTTF